MTKSNEFDYSVVRGERMNAALATELSSLFSSAYGKWSRRSPIRLTQDYYLSNYAKRGFHVALCRVGAKLVAEAVHLETPTPSTCVAAASRRSRENDKAGG